MNVEFKTIEKLIEEDNKFINAIPNYLGINLCSVKGVKYVTQKDGQLLSLSIIFQPNNEIKSTHEE